MQIHPMFHVSMLELFVENTFLGHVVATPLPTQVDDIPEFEVRKILDSKFRRKKLFYLVDWVGYDAFERSWEPTANLLHAP